MGTTKLIIASRENEQYGYFLQFKITFKCPACNREVEPEELKIGRRHVYAVHCKQQFEVGLIS